MSYSIYRRASYPVKAKAVRVCVCATAEEARNGLRLMEAMEGAIAPRDLAGRRKAAVYTVRPPLPPESVPVREAEPGLTLFAILAVEKWRGERATPFPAKWLRAEPCIWPEHPHGPNNLDEAASLVVQCFPPKPVGGLHGKVDQITRKPVAFLPSGAVHVRRRVSKLGADVARLLRPPQSIAARIAEDLSLYAGPRASAVANPGYETHGHGPGYSLSGYAGERQISYGPVSRFYRSRR